MTKDNQFAFYIMGPSGAGKDSIIQAISEHYQNQISIPARYITRKKTVEETEQHNVLSTAVFEEMLEKGCFSLHWEANNCQYAYDKQWLNDLADNKVVLLNGSREYWPVAKQNFGQQLLPVTLCLDVSTQRQRLESRARESDGEIDERIARSNALSACQDNTGFQLNANQPLSQVVQDFIDYLILNTGESWHWN